MKQVSWIVALAVGLVAGITLDRMTGGAGAPRLPARPAPTQPSGPPPTPQTTAAVVAARADDPSKGPEGAKLDIILFSDFQCPFCARVEPILKQVELAYPGAVHLVWKHLPLQMHPQARPAAEAAEAARLQGKFWPMHDQLFQNQRALSPEMFVNAAHDIGLDVERFKQSLAAHEGAARVDDDLKEAASLGVVATPTWFVNCRKIEGAYPFESVKPILDEEVRHADKLMAEGKSGAALTEALCQENVKKYPAAPPRVAAAPPVIPGGRSAVPERADDPAQGKASAPVTLVEFSDFQCPWCARAEPTVKEIEQAHPDDVRIVWKHFPLVSIHPNAMPAALAAEAAREQGGAGKFWAMHDKLFSNQQALSDATYMQYARELGLDVSRFEKELASPQLKARVEEDSQLGAKLGVNGTPTFIVNGEKVSANELKPTVERLLAQARAR